MVRGPIGVNLGTATGRAPAGTGLGWAARAAVAGTATSWSRPRAVWRVAAASRYMGPVTDTNARNELPPEMNAGWATAMGLEIVTLSAEEVVVEWVVDGRHLQPYGIVHGGVHSGVIETVCSLGAGAVAIQRGQIVMGIENHTSFLRAVRDGRLRATGKPVHVGQRMQLWEATIVDGDNRVVATGRVRLFCQEGPPSGGRG